MRRHRRPDDENPWEEVVFSAAAAVAEGRLVVFAQRRGEAALGRNHSGSGVGMRINIIKAP
jgi:hypothetical protein